MKKFIYKREILMICLTLQFSFYSCSNDGTSNDELGNNNVTNLVQRLSPQEIEETYNRIIQIKDLDEQLLVASALSPEDNFSLWQYKLEDFKIKNKLSIEQINFINHLKIDLNENVFVENSEERAEFLLNKKNNYMTNAKLLFGENEGWYLLTKVENINHSLKKLAAGGGGPSGGPGDPIKSCGCETNSGCIRLTGISMIGLSWEYGTCQTGDCYVQTYLFGLWESANKGLCTY